MTTFLQDTLAAIRKNRPDFSKSTLILPSKRAGRFLMHELKNNNQNTQFAPRILSIEELIEEIADLNIIDSTELLFKAYTAYLATKSIREKEPFDSFSTWALTILNDFNEIDRYLISPDNFFTYLADIKTLERWGVEKENSQLVSNYLQFWKGLPEMYWNLWNLLIKEKLGYQGMVYREAANNISDYALTKKEDHFVFIGFNALNMAEQKIVQTLLSYGNAEIHWDCDQHFYEDKNHSSSLFIRKYLNNWDHYTKNEKPIFPSNFLGEKQFKIVEVQKDIGQAKYVGETLANFSNEELQKTAIVLGNENLLLPVLTSLPKNVEKINVTMGVPLNNFPATIFFELLFNLQLRSLETIYYKDVFAILSHPTGVQLVHSATEICADLNLKNITHISPETLLGSSNDRDKNALQLLFKNWSNDGNLALDSSLQLLDQLDQKTNSSQIERLVIHKLMEVFKSIRALSEKYPYLESVKTVLNLFTELTSSMTLDFEGDAYNGPQIMGVLETRLLDFEHLIITSVNEGVFPSGKSNNSFITFDLKQQFQLPLYHEKDAIYTYHFYRMLQRAKTVTLLYNSFSEGLNSGEKSRFITQLETEGHPNHTFEKIVLSPTVNITNDRPKEISKTLEIMERLREISGKGFSPSALTSYIRNPLEFYFQKVLRLQEFEEIEENVAANTLGTIVHDTMEVFYKPFEGHILKTGNLEAMKQNINEEVTKQFQKTFRGGTFTYGKNRIVFEVAKRYIHNFLNLEISEINAGNEIKIEKIETKLLLNIPIPELDFKVNITGIVDRVDRFNGNLRIIDYKTGKVEQKDLEITEWESLSQDYKFSKAFQVLAYTAMISQEIPVDNVSAGIISFKNINNGFLRFATKTEKRYSQNYEITPETLELFLTELKTLILEICNPDIPFIEKIIEQ